MHFLLKRCLDVDKDKKKLIKSSFVQKSLYFMFLKDDGHYCVCVAVLSLIIK